ncbi:PadR family transcriptional regulator, partial [Kitasatospora sp. NPDC058263]
GRRGTRGSVGVQAPGRLGRLRWVEDEVCRPLSEVERHRESHAALLARYLHGEQRDFPDPTALDARQQLQHVVLRGGIEYERMTLAWLDDVLATLHRLAADRTGA